MSNWGISDKAEEKEKIKSQYADFLNGLNSVGELHYSIYSELFDVGMKLLDEMYELGKSKHIKTKTFSKELFLSFSPRLSESDCVMSWVNECEGKTVEECNYLGYGIEDRWLK